jgi:hypothetical protein
MAIFAEIGPKLGALFAIIGGEYLTTPIFAKVFIS